MQTAIVRNKHHMLDGTTVEVVALLPNGQYRVRVLSPVAYYKTEDTVRLNQDSLEFQFSRAHEFGTRGLQDTATLEEKLEQMEVL